MIQALRFFVIPEVGVSFPATPLTPLTYDRKLSALSFGPLSHSHTSLRELLLGETKGEGSRRGGLFCASHIFWFRIKRGKKPNRNIPGKGNARRGGNSAEGDVSTVR